MYHKPNKNLIRMHTASIAVPTKFNGALAVEHNKNKISSKNDTIGGFTIRHIDPVTLHIVEYHHGANGFPSNYHEKQPYSLIIKRHRS